MAEPSKNPDRAAMMKILLPFGAIAAMFVLIAILWAMSEADLKMSDGSNGGVDDPGLIPAAVEGIKYRDVVKGTGGTLPVDAKVRVRYKGWLTNGSVFDSNNDATFELKGGVIRGWKEGLPGMQLGGIRKLVIEPEMAYGSQDRSGIPPNSTLIFEVMLLEIITGEDAAMKEVTAHVVNRPARVKPGTLSDGTLPGAEDPNLKEIQPGLKYRDIREGVGTATREGAVVKIDYTGWLLNGTAFDSSVTNPSPTVFKLDNLVRGWQLGIPGMKPGGVRKLVIAPELAYGPKPMGVIPPNSTLVFEIEMHFAK